VLELGQAFQNGEISMGWCKYRVGKTNEAGISLLSFYTLNRLIVMNTWFEKKHILQIYLATPWLEEMIKA